MYNAFCPQSLHLFLLLMFSLPVFTAAAQVTATAQPPAAHMAPVPSSLLNAKTVFISNAGSDSGLFPHPFSGDPDRAYVQFFSAVQSMGRFQIVPDPSQADIILELQLTAPNGPQSPNKQNGASDPLPMLRLVIYDRPTHYVLWALTESVYPALTQKTHDRNFDDALGLIAADLAKLASNTPPSAHGNCPTGTC